MICCTNSPSYILIDAYLVYQLVQGLLMGVAQWWLGRFHFYHHKPTLHMSLLKECGSPHTTCQVMKVRLIKNFCIFPLKTHVCVFYYHGNDINNMVIAATQEFNILVDSEMCLENDTLTSGITNGMVLTRGPPATLPSNRTTASKSAKTTLWLLTSTFAPV